MPDYSGYRDEYAPSTAAVLDTAEDPVLPRDERQVHRPKVLVPVILFVLTCLSTIWAGAFEYSLTGALLFAGALMLTLLAHEFGHFFQARRYRVPASLPYFIPLPISPIGTMGAVIGMQPGVGNRKSLFDIAITGPLAGLVPALAFTSIGLSLSEVRVIQGLPEDTVIGAPLLFQWLREAIVGPLAPGQLLDLHPLAFAGWVGIFITALNLIPIGQLDGGHILYALLRRKAHIVATLLLIAAALAVVWYGYIQWTLMILLLLFIGPRHPPTADDYVELGTGRIFLGCVTLPFVLIGFTPTPFIFIPGG
jgi:membrane-associated protease RseP (regulator of RpoE activity)